jgi:hypothetical protein
VPGAAGDRFDIRNAEGLSLVTPCVTPLTEMPFDWRQRALKFRQVEEIPPERSTPIPPPRG